MEKILEFELIYCGWCSLNVCTNGMKISWDEKKTLTHAAEANMCFIQ